MNRVYVTALALAAAAGAARAQSVEFRFVERTNQTAINLSDPLVEIAVQARVTGGNLGAFSFNVAITGESESFGTLNRVRINNASHTYFTGGPWGTLSTVGQGGIASQYSYLASLNAGLNGQINASGGGFTNNPAEQEIGNIVGRAMGPQMTNTPGMDPSHEGNPATWSGYGVGATPPVNSLASLDPALAGPYFGGGEFFDIYRFSYLVADFSPRELHFVLRNMTAENFTRMTYGPGLWGAQDTTVAPGSIDGAPLSITLPSGFGFIIPAPGSVALLGLGGLLVGRRRRA